MSKTTMIDITHKITDELQHEAAVKLQKATEYYKGYIQACEDFGRRMRGVIIIEEANKDE